MDTLALNEINVISTLQPSVPTLFRSSGTSENTRNGSIATIFLGSRQTRFSPGKYEYHLHTQDTIVPADKRPAKDFIFNIEIIKNYCRLLKSSQSIMLVLEEKNEYTEAIALKLCSLATAYGKTIKTGTGAISPQSIIHLVPKHRM